MHRYTVCAFSVGENSVREVENLLKKEFPDLCIEHKGAQEEESIMVDLSCVDNDFEVVSFLNKHSIITDNEAYETTVSMPDYLEFF